VRQVETDFRGRTVPHQQAPTGRGRRRNLFDLFARPHSGWAEVGLLLALYVGYSVSRLLASNDLGEARTHAYRILHWERSVGLDVEASWDRFFATHDVVGVLASYWYASGHYIVTAIVLFLLYRHGGGHYAWARTALVVSTLIGLAMYLLMPTAPPRLSGLPYVDVLAEHAGAGWWGSDASAPRGLGGMTNQLAAMPSLHAGWALWVAAVAFICGMKPVWKVLASAYAVITAVVVIGTANHWVSDVIVGWGIVLLAVIVCRPLGGLRERAMALHQSPVDIPSLKPDGELPTHQSTHKQMTDTDVATELRGTERPGCHSARRG